MKPRFPAGNYHEKYFFSGNGKRPIFGNEHVVDYQSPALPELTKEISKKS